MYSFKKFEMELVLPLAFNHLSKRFAFRLTDHGVEIGFGWVESGQEFSLWSLSQCF